MWAHYGDDFKGVCLKLDPILLERALSKKGWRWRRIETQYTPGKLGLSDDLLEDIVTLVSVKHSDWSYEQEIRYIILIDDADSSNQSGFKVPIDDALQEIHVSDQVDESCVEKYRALAPELTIRRITGKKRYGWLEEVDYRDS